MGRTLFFLGLFPGHLAPIEGISKSGFSQKSFFSIPDSVFWCFPEALAALGAVFLICVSSETKFKIDGFSSGCQSQRSTGGGGKSYGFLSLLKHHNLQPAAS